MTTLTLFKSKAPSMGYVFANGHTIHFAAGQYATSSKFEIDELTKECENGHPNFYIDDGAKTVESEAMDPIAVLRARIREEERAALIAATDPKRDMGETKQGKLEGIANSHTIAGLQAASNAQATAAQTPIAAGTITVATRTSK